MTIGEKIRQLRTEKGMTQKELGSKCGLADSAIRRYELGGANPKIDTITKIANALGVNIFDLAEIPCTVPAEKDYIQFVKTEHAICPPETNNTGMLNTQIMQDFHKLNTLGQQEAVKRVQELTEIPRYTECV